MNIALLGYGRMGKTIEKIAKNRKHNIALTVDKNDDCDLDGVDVAIDFSVPDAAVDNISQCLEAHVPIVSGTTGWLEHYDEMTALCKKNNGSFLYASNFSVGVNVFFELNRKLAEMMQQFEQYDVSLKEVHHIHKLDAPSGTAISLAEDVLKKNDRYKNWSLDEKKENNIPIYAERENEVPGTHTITYKSEIDTIKIEHEAHSREGFALGAVLAAEWIKDKKGVFTMKDVLAL